jgi:hypothetical protein
MVKNRLLWFALVTAVVLMMFSSTTSAWSGTYHLDNEWVKIWINQDGSIDLAYNITITLDSGNNINWVSVGQPNGYFTIGNATDQYGNKLYATDASQGSDYNVQVPLNKPLRAGETVWFTLITNVAHMIYDDTMNPGNVGMQFIPTWFAANISDLRILIVLPPNVTASIVKTTQVYWDNTFSEEGRLAVFWEERNLSPNQQYPVGVSFPKQYVQHSDTEPPSPRPPDWNPPTTTNPSPFIPYLIPLLFLGAFIFIIVIIAIAASKRQYLNPEVSMETLGIRHGLTAVEASYLLDLKPTKIVTEILYSVLQKRAVWVEDTKPSIKLQIMPKFKENPRERKEALRYYETDFLNAIKDDGTLDEEKLAGTVMVVRDNVEDKMRGYCRRDTVEYYKSVVVKAWKQVEQAGTPELASNAYDEQLLWLLLDPDVRTRTQTVFHERQFEPNPMWLWFWFGYQHYNPHPTYMPNVQTPAQSAKPPVVPGADFANNIATAVERTSNNIVVNVEKFANAILPMPKAEASHEPIHSNATCVCACHACACVCACVSCACACAGGGVG